jgi:hypothetical protein
MNKTLLATLIALTAGLGLASMAHAADDAQKAAAKEKWAAKTPEEKAAAKEKAKAKWDAKTPEEQAAAKSKFAEKHPKAAAKMTEKKEGATQ